MKMSEFKKIYIEHLFYLHDEIKSLSPEIESVVCDHFLEYVKVEIVGDFVLNFSAIRDIDYTFKEYAKYNIQYREGQEKLDKLIPLIFNKLKKLREL